MENGRQAAGWNRACRDWGRLICLLAVCGIPVPLSAAEAIRMAEPYTDSRAFQSTSTITTEGKVQAAKGADAKEELELKADVSFEFLGRRLPPAGRDAEALREARSFQKADLVTRVAGYETKASLPDDRRLIVVNGSREGLISYSPQGLLTRETVDLLEIPGDALSLLALLPSVEVSPGGEWTPPDWALQMLTGMEAVESSELKCRLDQATPSAAKVTYRGKIKGQKLGTNTSVDVVGVFLFNLESRYLTQAKTVYTITSDVGTVHPGLNLKVTAVLARKPVEQVGELADDQLAKIPLEPPAESLALRYAAEPWGLELRHDRDWHLFQAVYSGGAPVAILRLVDLGSLVSQCNLSPAPAVPAGSMTPMEQFEADIRQSLAERFGDIVSQETIPLDDGRKMHRVAVTGSVLLRSEKGRTDLPMTWIYYLVSNPEGRQASFVFSVEPDLLDQLKARDRELVMTLKFVRPAS